MAMLTSSISFLVLLMDTSTDILDHLQFLLVRKESNGSFQGELSRLLKANWIQSQPKLSLIVTEEYKI